MSRDVDLDGSGPLALGPRRRPEPHGQRPWPAGWTPERALAVVVAAVGLNQVLFTVHVTAVHGGDASFVARYLPSGWFAIPRGRFWSGLAAVWPHPELLAPTVLRVQALLELPFVVLAYLAVTRRLAPDVAARLARPCPGLAARQRPVPPAMTSGRRPARCRPAARIEQAVRPGSGRGG